MAFVDCCRRPFDRRVRDVGIPCCQGRLLATQCTRNNAAIRPSVHERVAGLQGNGFRVVHDLRGKLIKFAQIAGSIFGDCTENVGLAKNRVEGRSKTALAPWNMLVRIRRIPCAFDGIDQITACLVDTQDVSVVA